MVTTIVLRIFPSGKDGRRASFSSSELKINKDKPVVSDIFASTTQVSPSTHKLARGISFLKPPDVIEEGEIINAIPL